MTDTVVMAQRRVGLWLIGACGGVAGTTALGLSALARGLTPTTGMVTALPQFSGHDFDEPTAFEHDDVMHVVDSSLRVEQRHSLDALDLGHVSGRY